MIEREPLRTVTAEEVEAFERDGYIVLRSVLSPAWLVPLEAAVERILASPYIWDVTAEAVKRATQADPDALFGAALSTSTLLDEPPERRPMTVILVSGAWRQFCGATA